MAAPRSRPRGASPSAISAAEPAGAARAWAASETRDNATQTSSKPSRSSPNESGGEVSPALGERDAETVKRSDFLFGPIQLQSELGMAIQAALEFTAEQRATASPPDIVALGRMHLADQDGSDGENMAEDLEVRSLSLSEDGPVISRELSDRERQTAAPDPIAMLERSGPEYGSSEKKNGSSDLSAAGTESAPADMGAAGAESHEQSLCRNLLPILQPIFEKTAELSGSEPAGASDATFRQRLAPMRHAPPTKVRPVKSLSGGTTALNLAELKAAGSRGDAALANLSKERRASHPDVGTRSELSFGSEYSAFTSVSSPSSQGALSSSNHSTPRHGRGLTGVASMPSLQPYRGSRPGQ